MSNRRGACARRNKRRREAKLGFAYIDLKVALEAAKKASKMSDQSANHFDGIVASFTFAKNVDPAMVAAAFEAARRRFGLPRYLSLQERLDRMWPTTVPDLS